jgi:hypothetical protein
MAIVSPAPQLFGREHMSATTSPTPLIGTSTSEAKKKKKQQQQHSLHVHTATTTTSGNSTHTQHQLPKSTTNSWASPKDTLRPLDYYHPLAPSHVKVTHSQLEPTLNLLQQAFQQLSCHVLYEHELLACTCDTMDNVQFHVSIWDGGADKGLFVEVQRMYGDSFTFHHKYAAPLLRTIHRQKSCIPAVVVVQPPPSPPTLPTPSNVRAVASPPPPIPGRALDRLSLPTTFPNEGDIQTALDLATDLIDCQCMDAQQMCVESLLQLTNPLSTGQATAARIANIILQGQERPDLTRFLWQSLVTPTMTSDAGSNNRDDMTDVDEYDSFDDSTRCVLQIWVQMWQLQSSSPTVGTGVEQQQQLHGPSVMQVVDVLQAYISTPIVDCKPHLATLALQGLTALTRLVHPVKERIDWEPVQYANTVGTARHAALAQASLQLLAVQS